MRLFDRLPPALSRRAVGAVYLLYFVVAFAGGGLRNHALIVASDAVYVVLTLLFFFLLRAVNQPVAILATACSLAGQVLAVGFGAAAAGLVADGLFLVLLGWLWFLSRLIPRPLAVLVAVAGVGWLAFAFPAVSSRIGIFVEVLGGVSELLLMLWLVVRGVDPARAAGRAVAAPAAELRV